MCVCSIYYFMKLGHYLTLRVHGSISGVSNSNSQWVGIKPNGQNSIFIEKLTANNTRYSICNQTHISGICF